MRINTEFNEYIGTAREYRHRVGNACMLATNATIRAAREQYDLVLKSLY